MWIVSCANRGPEEKTWGGSVRHKAGSGQGGGREVG